MSDIEHELIATLWDLKVAKDRIDKLTKSNLQLRQGAEEQKQRIKRLEDAGDAIMKSINCRCPYGESVFYCQTCSSSWDAWRKAKEDKP